MKVQVTQRHIDEGWPKNACGCPVAKAINEALAARYIYTWCAVGRNFIVIRGESIKTPEKVEEFILYFDNNIMDRVHPFEFELEYE